MRCCKKRSWLYFSKSSGCFFPFHFLPGFGKQVQEINSCAKTGKGEDDAHGALVINAAGQAETNKNHKTNDEQAGKNRFVHHKLGFISLGDRETVSNVVIPGRIQSLNYSIKKPAIFLQVLMILFLMKC